MVTASKFDLDTVVMQYGKNETYLADYPLNLGLVDVLKTPLDGQKIMKAVNDFIEAKRDIRKGKEWNTWAVRSNSSLRTEIMFLYALVLVQPKLRIRVFHRD